jgi:hypothetical protein
MELVEYYRNRSWLIWCIAIAVMIAITIGAVAMHTVVDVNGSPVSGAKLGAQSHSDAAAIALAAMFIALIFATSVGLSLNRENETRALSWTKPVPRAVLAVRMFLTDLAMVAVVYVATGAITFGLLAFLHTEFINVDAVVPEIFLTLGVTFMWYALVQLLTSGLGPNGRGSVAFLWIGAILLGALRGAFGGVLHAIISVLNILNPLAYTSTSIGASDGTVSAANAPSFWQYPVEERAIVVWLLAVAMCAIATAVWSRREA